MDELPSGAADPDTTTAAERAYAEFLGAVEGDPNADFEAFCVARPDLEDDLRRLHAVWQDVSRVLGDNLSRLMQPAALATSPGGSSSVFAAEPPLMDLLRRLRESSPRRSRYDLKGEVARGGMGVILRAFDRTLRRDLAMKVIGGPEASGPTAATPPIDSKSLGRFLEEAQITGQLDHPGIVPVHELGLDDDGRIYFTMKLVQGEDLRAVFARVHDPANREWSQARALATLLRACEAVAFAHDRGVVHRDLKPANIMVGAYGETYVMDWGLARVLDQIDRKNIRVREAPSGDDGSVRPRIGGDRDDDDVSPLVTVDGDVLGTPAYMPPEQALGQIDRVGKAADVYALGAVLYHLLSGRSPYVGVGERVPARELLDRVRRGPPDAVRKAAPDAPAELCAICEKAMSRDPERRYPSMSELAADLQAYLERRVVAAYESGRLAELRKWVARNRTAASTIVAALVLVIATTAWYIGDIRAREQAALQSRAEFELLAGVRHLEEAATQEAGLYPAVPGRIRAMEAWLSDSAVRLRDLLPKIRATVATLQSRAMPWSDEDRARDRATHPREAELRALERKAASYEAAQAVRDGRLRPQPADFPEFLVHADTKTVRDYAWIRVIRDDAFRVWGEEDLALGIALEVRRRATASGDPLEMTEACDLLAWAWLANGRDEEALAAARDAVQWAARASADDGSDLLKKVEDAVEATSGILADLRHRRAALLMEVSERRTWRFPEESERFLHATLMQLAPRIEAFERGAGAGVERRLAWARSIEAITLNHPNAQATWADARTAILAADDAAASALYRVQPLDLSPQLGLVPIGKNPVTGLWEFYDLRSATDVVVGQDPRQVAIPEHRTDGTIEVGDDTGIVFVLIPGGTFRMGAQPFDPNAPGYVEWAEDGEAPVHDVTLPPYFIARHELTMGQWKRLSDGGAPSWHQLGYRYDNDPVTIAWAHPVNNVSWQECNALLAAHGIRLPTEAQWERAARADTDTPWWTGEVPASLAGAANLLDERAARAYPARGRPMGGFDDGFVGISPVGWFRANRFGLHDVAGNVWEWCQDAHLEYRQPVREEDGLRMGNVVSEDVKVYRGGSVNDAAPDVRAAVRVRDASGNRKFVLGVRAARAVE